MNEVAELKAQLSGVTTERNVLRHELEVLRQKYYERTCAMIVHRGQALACSEDVAKAYHELRREVRGVEPSTSRTVL